jgi:methyl-accepting chemotaxis protein
LQAVNWNCKSAWETPQNLNRETVMLDQIRDVLAPPVFEGDEEKTRTARLLHAILWAGLAMILLGSFSLFLVQDPARGKAAVGTMVLIVSGALVLTRLGYVRPAGVLFSLCLWLFDTFMIVVSGGVDSPMFSGYIVVVLISGLLLGNYAAVAFAGLSVVAGIGAFVAGSNGALPAAVLFVDPVGRLLAPLVNLVVSAVLLYLAIRNVDDALGRVRRNERELAESNRELLDVRASLERRNERLHVTVRRYDDYMAEVGRGNLAAQLDVSGDGRGMDDPLVALGHRLNKTVSSLRLMTIQTREAAYDLNSAVTEILAATTQQATGANEQSVAISQTTTTVDELGGITKQSVVRAQEVAEASRRTLDVSRAGQQAVRETIGSMRKIRFRVESIAGNILALSEQTQQVGEIIATVNDIAAQSNILALNASVEAARAGEYGKGFAVVAVEVRNLAEQSRQATAQVRTILSDIQKATNMTVMATEDGTKGVDEGVRLATRAQQSIERLGAVIEESAQAAVQMVAGGRQQATGVEQIAVAMESINQAAVQSLSSIRQAETAAQNLNDLARSLAEIVHQYNV